MEASVKMKWMYEKINKNFVKVRFGHNTSTYIFNVILLYILFRRLITICNSLTNKEVQFFYFRWKYMHSKIWRFCFWWYIQISCNCQNYDKKLESDKFWKMMSNTIVINFKSDRIKSIMLEIQLQKEECFLISLFSSIYAIQWAGQSW